MAEYILLGAMALVVVALLFLRANAAVCFLALCAGSVLVASSGDNMSLVASSLTSGMSSAAYVARIVLIAVPFLACLYITRGQVSKALMPFSLIPAVCAALLAALLLTPLLPPELEVQVTATQTWELLMQYREPITGVGVVSSIILLSFTVKKPKDKHKKGHH